MTCPAGGSWTPSPVSFAVQWKKPCPAEAGVTGSQPTPPQPTPSAIRRGRHGSQQQRRSAITALIATTGIPQECQRQGRQWRLIAWPDSLPDSAMRNRSRPARKSLNANFADGKWTAIRCIIWCPGPRADGSGQRPNSAPLVTANSTPFSPRQPWLKSLTPFPDYRPTTKCMTT